MPTNVLAAGVLSLQIVLPAFNYFAERAELDIKLPLTTNRITKSNLGKISTGVLAVFDNRHQFNWTTDFHTNYVGRWRYMDRKYDSAHVPLSHLPELAQKPSLITSNEAVALAERCFSRLGYSLLRQKVRPPEVRQYTYAPDEKTPARLLPLFNVRWYAKHPPEGLDHPYGIEMQVSGLTKRIVRFDLFLAEDAGVDVRQFATNSVPGKEKVPQKFD